MKAWSDEWRCARLELRLRGEELFQGEAVALEVRAEVPPSVNSREASAGTARVADVGDGQHRRPLDALVQRWRGHCEDARVQIRVVEPPAKSGRSGATLFRQETQFALISGEEREEGAVAAVLLRAQFDLRVRREFWDHAVVLKVRITPTSSAVDEYRAGSGSGEMKPEAPWLTTQTPLAGAFLSEDWADSQLFPLLREEAQPTAVTTRYVEKLVRIAKPLALAMETRNLAGQRVGVLARVVNAHPTLALDVRDVHLHLDELSPMASAAPDTSCRSRSFQVVSADKVPFPVVLRPHEHYHFLFVLELSDGARERPAQEHDGRQHASGEMTSGNAQEKGNKNRPDECLAPPQPQQVLLTLSWQASGVTMDAITEIHTAKWSPAVELTLHETRSDKDRIGDDVRALVPPVLAVDSPQVAGSQSPLKYVRLRPDSALQSTVTLTVARVAVGEPVAACVTVTNRSSSMLFDLTLVLPTQEGGSSCVVGDKTQAAPAWVSFEASHHLGLLRPGMSVHRSVHLVFLRSGKCTLGPLLLLDALSGVSGVSGAGMTSTCFIACGRDVFVGR